MSILFCSGFLVAGEFREKEHLLLYANFETSADPVFAADGTSVDVGTGMNFIAGKKGKGIHFGKTDPETHVRYRLAEPLDNRQEWTIAFYLRPDNPAVTDHQAYSYLFRTDNTGTWKDGNIIAGFCKWGAMRIQRFDSKRKMYESHVSASLFAGQKWTHFALASKQGKMTLFVNGIPASLAPEEICASGSPQHFLRIGALDKNTKSRFAGTLDELKVFNKALTADQVKLIMDTEPGRIDEKTPLIQCAFNGKIDCISSAGPVLANAAYVVFRPAVIGKGASFLRHGYDRAGRLTISDVFGTNGNELSASFFFIPGTAPATDHQERGLLASRSGKRMWSLFRQGGKLIFDVSGKRISADISGWKTDHPVHIAAIYSRSAGTMSLFLDGKHAVSAELPTFQQEAAKSVLFIGDMPEGNTYSITQAEGIIDELRIFSSALTEKEILAEIARKNDPSVLSDSSGKWMIAETPASHKEEKLWSLDGAETRRNEFRTEVTLNALWRFQLTLPGRKPSANKWHYMAVPGRYAGYDNGMTDHVFLMRDRNFKVLGKALFWEGVRGYKLSDSYWERKLILKPAWKSKHLSLHFDSFSAETGLLFLNGKFVAEIKGEHAHTVPLPPSLLLFDKPNTLQIALSGASRRWEWRGLRSNITLRILSDVTILHPQVLTSVQQKTLGIRTTVCNRSSKTLSLRLRATVQGTNAPEPFESDAFELHPGEEKEIAFSRKWDNPLLWDWKNPNLYTCVLKCVSADGKTLDEIFPIRFGFREFRITGKNYTLNEKTVHLFNAEECINFTCDAEKVREMLRALKRFGYNAIRLSFARREDMSTLLRVADEEGILLMVNLIGVSGTTYAMWNSPETKAGLEHQMASDIREWNNHPSIIMWYLSVNFLGYPVDYHPLKMADGYLPSAKAARYQVARNGERILRKYDTTRPFFYQAGGAHGPVINSNAYFCWWPQAERRTWAEEWRKIGKKPLHIIETSFPYVSSMTGMDKQFRGVSKVKFIHENAARYLGNDGYDASQELVNRYSVGSRDGKSFSGVTLYSYHFRFFERYTRMKILLLSDTIKYWRSSGISGICPFGEFAYGFQRLNYKKRVDPGDFRRYGWHPDILKSTYQQDADFSKPLPFGLALRDAFAPVLVFIGGTESEPTSERSSYFAGSPIQRMLFLINDTLEQNDFSVRLTLKSADGRAAGVSTIRRTLEPGEIARIPIEFKAPAVSTKKIFRLEAETIQPSGVRTDRVELSIFPSVKPSRQGTIALYDSENSKTDLANAGIRFRNAAALSSLDGIDLLVVGKNALMKQEFFQWAKKHRLGTAKLNILLLEQSAEGLAKLGFLTRAVDARNVFKISNEAFPHSLSDRELSNWDGPSTLVQNKVLPAPQDYIAIPEQLWRWNTINTVASTPIRRPSTGRTISYLSCGLDLAYSALLEVPTPNGILLLCQMELSGRTGREPAAAQLLAELAERYSTIHPLPPPGGKRAEACSDLLGFVQNGGNVLVTNPAPELLSRLGLSMKKGTAFEFRKTEAGEGILGDLSRRDLFFSSPLPFTAVSGNGVVALTEPVAVSCLKHGRGTFYFACFDRTHLNKRLVETKAISQSISDYWAQHVMLERIQQIESRLLGEMPPNLAARLEEPYKADDLLSLNGSWYFRLDPNDSGKKRGWQNSASFGNGWTTIKVPAFWESQRIPEKFGNTASYDGIAWYAKQIILPESFRNRDLVFSVNAIDDLDETYVNGVLIGSTDETTKGYWAAPRNYRIPAELTKSGKLTVIIRVTDLRGDGGIPEPVSLIGRNSSGGTLTFPYDLETFPTYHTESAIRW